MTKALKDRAWGFRITRNSTRLTKALIYSQPPLLEIAIVELGRTYDSAAIPVLIRVLRSRAGGGRAQAALALGAFGGPEATRALINALSDAVSGWVRFNAYRGLRDHAQASRRRAESEFGIDRMVEQYDSMYREVLGRC